jgi:uncharacterized protein YjbJ (UPF0337 family)
VLINWLAFSKPACRIASAAHWRRRKAVIWFFKPPIIFSFYQITRRSIMNWDQVKGNWHQMKGAAKAQWGRLTDDELDQIAGEHERLVGIIQERYGIAREEAEKQVDSFNWKM